MTVPSVPLHLPLLLLLLIFPTLSNARSSLISECFDAASPEVCCALNPVLPGCCAHLDGEAREKCCGREGAHNRVVGCGAEGPSRERQHFETATERPSTGTGAEPCDEFSDEEERISCCVDYPHARGCAAEEPTTTTPAPEKCAPDQIDDVLAGLYECCAGNYSTAIRVPGCFVLSRLCPSASALPAANRVCCEVNRRQKNQTECGDPAAEGE